MRVPVPAALTALLLAAAATPANAQPAAAAPRVELPITERVLSDGARRYTVPLRVGAVTIEAGLDTGSTGLRVLPGVLSETDAQASRRAERYAYGSGAQYDGVIATGRLTFGDGETTAGGSVDLQLIQKVGCTDAKPTCPASRVPQAQYGIQGDGLPGEGFKAILGLNSKSAALPNPLAALGVTRWIVDLPRPGEGRPGRLVLNPTDADMASYTRLKWSGVNDRTNLHDMIPACLVAADGAGGRRICGPTLLDTGAPGVVIVTPQPMTPWRDGVPATLAFQAPGASPPPMALTIGRREQASHMTVQTAAGLDGPRIQAGIAPYFGFSVLYDPTRGEIGLKPRDAAH